MQVKNVSAKILW